MSISYYLGYYAGAFLFLILSVFLIRRINRKKKNSILSKVLWFFITFLLYLVIIFEVIEIIKLILFIIIGLGS